MIRNVIALLAIAALAAGPASGCGKAETQKGPVIMTVSAAASLKDSAEEISALYGKQQPAIAITYNFASSGTLQRQIEEGAPVDLFISAGTSQMDALSQKNLLMNDTRTDLIGNELVLISRKDFNLSGFEGLTGKDINKVAIGVPETVPAGKYAREALAALGIWDDLQSNLVLAKDVRQVLTYVETGNAEAGLVYRSDALSGRNIKISAAAPAGTHQPIVYPAAVIKTTKHPEEAREFSRFLTGEQAAAVFLKNGFKPIKK